MTPRKIQAGPQLLEDIQVVIESSPSDSYLVEVGDLIHPFPDRWPGLLISSRIKLACEQRAVATGESYDQYLERFLRHCIGSIDLANENEVQPPFGFETAIGLVQVRINSMDSLTIRLSSD